MALKALMAQHFPGKRAIIRGNPPAVHDRKGPKASNFIEFYKKQTLQPVARHVAADPYAPEELRSESVTLLIFRALGST
jgi:hypothetical protein